MSQTYIITGAQGPLSPRLEIDDIQNNPKQWALLIQAVALMQQDPKAYPLAAASHWQQIGGIHGLPYSRWPGDPQGNPQPEPAPDENAWLGYCHHGSVLFPTWHRTALILLEQAVTEAADYVLTNTIAPLFAAAEKAQSGNQAAIQALQSELTLWQTAAATLRWPFWDWTLPETVRVGVPKILQQPQITLGMPNQSNPLESTSVTLPNPLYTYKFWGAVDVPAQWPQEGQYFDNWLRTYRWPTNNNPDGPNSVLPAPTEDYQEILDTFESGSSITPYGPPPIQVSDWAQRRLQVHDLFAIPVEDANKGKYPFYWDQFSNTSPVMTKTVDGKQVNIFQTLEQPHNTIHLNMGGDYGDMSFNDYAGFDPIFWLHHCNVDRLYAFWEYVYPDYWMGTGYYPDNDVTKPLASFVEGSGTYDLPENAPITESTGLTPFRKSKTEYWTSSDVHYVPAGPDGSNAKSYTYPDIKVGNVTVSLGKSWAVPDRQQYREALRQYFGASVPTQNDAQAKPPIFGATPSKVPPGHSVVKHFRQFAVHAEVPQSAFPRSHRLVLSFEGVPINDIAILTRIDSSRCAGCVGRELSGTKVVGYMHIPHELVVGALEHYGKNHGDVTDDEVIELLRSKLSARITSPGMKVTLAEAKPGLLSSTENANRPALAEDKRATLKLVSAAIVKESASNGPLLPTHYADVRDHGVLLGHDWAVSA